MGEVLEKRTIHHFHSFSALHGYRIKKPVHQSNSSIENCLGFQKNVNLYKSDENVLCYWPIN